MVDFNLYLITDRFQTGGRHLIDVVNGALEGGVKAVQLREKGLSTKELFEMAQTMRRLTVQYDAKLFINDRLDIAMAVEADGVHLGQRGFSAIDVRKIVGEKGAYAPLNVPRFLIGVSTHSAEEAKKAEAEGADFITVGPVFSTPSKAAYGRPLGVKIISQVKSVVKTPVFAIGGIKIENAEDVIKAGADGIAVISAIIGAENPAYSAREIVESLRQK